MPKIRLTQKNVDRQKAPTASRAPIILWDTDLKGFGLLVSGKTATKTYIAQRDLPGGQTRRVSIASVHEGCRKAPPVMTNKEEPRESGGKLKKIHRYTSQPSRAAAGEPLGRKRGGQQGPVPVNSFVKEEGYL